MVRSMFRLVPLCSVLLVVWADDRVLLTTEDERLWNTPPELIPEHAAKTSNLKNGRSLSIPIQTNFNVNTGTNAHSLGFQVGPETVSYSESSSFGQLLSPGNSGGAQSQSVAFSGGLTGIAGALSEAVSQFHPVHGTPGNANGQSVNFGSVATSSSGSIHNGHAASAVASSAGSSHSFATSGVANTGIIQHVTTIRFPGQNSQNRPIWTNIRPNHNNNGRHPPRMPKLEIEVKPNREQNRKPIILQVSTQRPRWENRQPTIHIRKWQQNHREFNEDEQI